MEALVRAERARDHARWAGEPDVAIEAHLRGINGAPALVLQWALREQARRSGQSVEIIYR